MIDENKLIEDLIFCSKLGRDSCREVSKIINSQPKIGEWIPCSKRLPENSDDVLVSFKDSNSICIAFYAKDKERWNVHTCVPYFADVIAWRPLPEPFNG